jgi:hypothetical protein
VAWKEDKKIAEMVIITKYLSCLSVARVTTQVGREGFNEWLDGVHIGLHGLDKLVGIISVELKADWNSELNFR